MPECEFCREFGTSKSNRFRDLYCGVVSSRVVDRTENFVAVPTLGQLFAGSLLVLPVAHAETCAALPSGARDELLTFVQRVLRRSSVFGEPVFFEHGATAESAGGCGIHHAHLHIVPLPRSEAAQALFPEYQSRAADLGSAWKELAGVDHYLLIGDKAETVYRNVHEGAEGFPSQFFRRRLVERFKLAAPWDWRAYDHVEPALIRTLTGYQCHAV